MKLAFKMIGSGEPVVILHGLFGMSDNWMNIAKNLAEDYSFYLVDLRNHGRSPHSEQMDFELMAEDVVEFLDAHNLKNVTLIGHSLGGKVAIQTAVLATSYLNKLVVVDIANKVYKNDYFSEYIEAMLAIELDKIESRKDAEQAFLEKKHVEYPVLQFLLKNLYRDNTNNFRWRFNLNALKNNLAKLMESVSIDTSVTTRTLFMKGSESSYIGSDDEVNIRNEFKNVSVATIEGANHWVHFTAQQNFINALLDFQKS